MTNDLQEHMNALERSAAYQVERVIKQAPQEITEEVFFEGHNGAKLGPFVRKRIARDSDLGRAYELLHEAQRKGRRFLYLPRIRDCFKTEDELIVVMDWVTGETLAEVLEQEGSSLEFAAPLFVKLCDAVAELHSAFNPPVIHRDITPSNVVVSAGVPTLIDLGIARSYNEDAALDTRQLGTFGYAAPEQYGFGQSDIRTDVYGLGMVLYFCCTGTTPDAKARACGFRAEEIPVEVSTVIERATALTPTDRYESAAALKQAFVAALDAYQKRLVANNAKSASDKTVITDRESDVGQLTLGIDPGVGVVGWCDIDDSASSKNSKRVDASAATSDLFSTSIHASTRPSSHASTSTPTLYPPPPSERDAKATSYPAPSSPGASTPSSPLPFVPALVWDIVLVLFWLICMVSLVFFGTFENPETGIKTPVLQKPFMLGVVAVIFTAPATMLFSSRPLQEYNRTWCWSWRLRLIILGCELCALVVLFILAALFNQ